MKKVLLRLLVSVLVMCFFLPIAPGANAYYYSDVTSSIGREYVDAINYISDNGIMVGTHTNVFEPSAVVTRAMAVTVLYRLAGDGKSYSNASKFVDVPSNSYYYNAVGWGVANGIVSGTSTDHFSPYDAVTTQMFISYLYRTAGYAGYPQTPLATISSVSDYNDISTYARTPMAWAVSYGICKKVGGNLYPKQSVQRKDLALYMYRYRLDVEGIVFGRDNFSFTNTSESFISGEENKLLISGNDKRILDAYASHLITLKTAA